MTYTIQDEAICGQAYIDAIKEVAEVLNRTLGTSYTYRNDWQAIEELATKLGIRFNENGEIVTR